MTGGTGFTDRDNTENPAFTGAANEGLANCFVNCLTRKSALHDSVPCRSVNRTIVFCLPGFRELVVRDGKALFNTSWIARIGLVTVTS